MAKTNINSISPFLVKNQLVKLDGAEKALIKLTAATHQEDCILLFSFGLVPRASAHPPAIALM